MHMQRLSSRESSSWSASNQSASSSATPTVDYLQEALDTLVVPVSPAMNELDGPLQHLQCPFPWPQADPSIKWSPDDIDTSLAAPLGVLNTEADGAHPTDAPAKKLNREYQRKFRLRHKVCN